MKKGLLVAMLMVAASAVFAAPQTTCPVLKGNPINPKLYVDVDGYRIYVCCGGCLSAVKADPGKYIKQMQAEGVELEKTPSAKHMDHSMPGMNMPMNGTNMNMSGMEHSHDQQ